ncbi:Pentatricopeptide repeat-containing protein [Thalictrum thalictroides]|uniref:Pentatricopeptide repeat-containing protein n=1 Tax=Thalictrum thalictroides TaxID=46969 RepID=A0A7J6VV31_THATH|nr:Pentatricopeptide repeat-containing protein [Thalictrum thalictroides]
MYSKNGCVEDAYHVFKNMGMKDIVSWNTMIGRYGMHGNGVAALHLLRDMCHVGIQPNLSQEFGITLTMEQFACVVDFLARAGQLEDVVQFINSMPIKPDKSICGAVLAACQAHQNINIRNLAAEHLFCLESKNPGNYVTLSNIYAKAGRWSDEVTVRKLMESRGLIKPSGYSWVDNEN